MIISNSKAFAFCNVAKINKLIQGQDINYVRKHLQKITLNGRDKVPDNEMSNVFNHYTAFKEKYDEHKEKYRKNPK